MALISVFDNHFQMVWCVLNVEERPTDLSSSMGMTGCNQNLKMGNVTGLLLTFSVSCIDGAAAY